MLIALIIALMLNAAQGYFLYNGARRLLQFDDLFQGIASTLASYSSDLVRMTSSDIDSVLTDHPEVISFHMRNMRARLEVQGVLEEVTRATPRRRKAPALPRPDME